MSTYEDEHNVATSSSTQSTEAPPPRHRHQPTLTQSIASFLADSESTTTAANSNSNNIINALRHTLENSNLDPQVSESLLSNFDSNNVVAELLSTISETNPDGGLNDTQKGLDDSFMDTLERVSIKSVKPSDTCPICTNDYHSDPYPLIVRLPCNEKHFFDLDCIAPWLKVNRTCPMCRIDVTKKKEVQVERPEVDDDEEVEEDWEMYG